MKDKMSTHNSPQYLIRLIEAIRDENTSPEDAQRYAAQYSTSVKRVCLGDHNYRIPGDGTPAFWCPTLPYR
jgi:hypothetical protein